MTYKVQHLFVKSGADQFFSSYWNLLPVSIFYVKESCLITIITLNSCLDRRAYVNSVNPDKLLQNAMSDQGLHCLPLMHQFSDTSAGRKTDFLNFQDKYVWQLRCPSVYGNYGIFFSYISSTNGASNCGLHSLLCIHYF